jgi:hypothetical protein
MRRPVLQQEPLECPAQPAPDGSYEAGQLHRARVKAPDSFTAAEATDQAG